MAKLRFILSDLVQQAEHRPEQTITKTLPHGLAVSVTVANGKYYLSLSRPDTHPSDSEFKTVLKYWPRQVTETPAYRTFIMRGRYCMAANWPITQQVTQ